MEEINNDNREDKIEERKSVSGSSRSKNEINYLAVGELE
jgi:hypothetical protein